MTWAAYLAFHAAMLDSGDVDPAYPVLRTVSEPMTADERAWLVILHLTYYQAGSALAAWCATGGEPGLPPAGFPCGTERRGNRDPARLRRNLLSWLVLLDQVGGPAAALSTAATVDGYAALFARVESVYGNGRWAAYKCCELARDVTGGRWPIPDMGHAHSTGPRKGLADLDPSTAALTGHDPETVAALDIAGSVIVDRLAAAGLRAPVEQVETTLCDFHSLTRGRYYVGHDIDAQAADLLAVPSDLSLTAARARAAVLPPAYLGNVRVDRARCRVYRDTGQVILR